MFSKSFLCVLCVLGGFNQALAISVTPQINTSNTVGGNIGLDDALKQLNAAGGTLTFPNVFGKFDIYLVDTGNDNTLTQVRAVNSNGAFEYQDFTIQIDGKGGSLFGDRAEGGKSFKGNPVRGFFVGGENSAGSTSGVTINNVFFTGCGAIGGSGSGGGMGAGGGLYVGNGTKVFINNCTFRNCIAMGGLSKSGSFLGGGGMKGDGMGIRGGDILDNTSGSGGGGGFGGNGEKGDSFNGSHGGGASDFPVGNATFFHPGGNFDGGRNAGTGGVGGGSTDSDLNGGFGGGGGKFEGNGGFGGGAGPGGCGGFGGGGGSTPAFGGDGGFGGGGAKNNDPGSDLLGTGGFGGGNADKKRGGNGAGFGGAIFMEPGAELTIGGSFMLSNNFATPPMGGGNPGLALGNDIFMMSSSILTFDTTSPVLLSNPIMGNQGALTPDTSASTATGGLIKKGANILCLVGDNTYTGTTSVEDGELQIQGTVVTNVEVKSGGKLTGFFQINQDNTKKNGGNLVNDGLFSPSEAIIAKTYTNNPGGILNIDITPRGILNAVTVGEKAKINGGTLQIFVGQGNYVAGTTYNLIVGPVDGAFDGNNNPNLIGPGASSVEVAVSTGSLILTVQNENIFIQFPDPLIPGSGGPIVLPSNTANQVITSFRQSNHPPESDLTLMIQSLGTLTQNELNTALPTLSARQFGSLEWVNARNNSYAADILSQHLFDLCCTPADCCGNGWISVFGNTMNNQKRLDDLQRYNADAVGVLVGYDTSCSCFQYGGAFGYTRTDLLWKKSAGGGDTDSYYGALYGSWDTGCCFITDFSILGGGTFNDMKRKVVFANVDRTARSDFWSYFVTAHLGFRSDWEWCCNNFEPFATVDYHYYTHESFTEKGATSLNLHVQSKDQHMMRGEAGMRWSREFDCGCYCYSPYIGLSWVGEFPLHDSKQPASFVGQSHVIQAKSYDSSVQLGAPQAGIKWSHCNGASFLLGYKGLYNGSVRINEIEGRFEYVF